MGSLGIEGLFKGVYNNKTVLITGNTGFKGSWLSLWLSMLGAKVRGYSLKDYTEPFHFNLLNLKSPVMYGDIRDKANLEKCIQESKPDIIFHLAAQSLVRASYQDPSFTYETNVIGTLNLFEAAKACSSVKVIINVTSDKVYENFEWDRAYNEKDILGGYDLYSSSKACSEILTASYRRSFLKNKILLATVRAGNVIGGGDWATDRLIPDVVKAVKEDKKVEIRNLNSIRPWQHVLEPLSGYLLLGQKLLENKEELASEWNFGPGYDQCVEVGKILEMMKFLWPKISYFSEQKDTIMHEARTLKLDCTKAQTQLSWNPIWNLEKTVEHTANWYKLFLEKNLVNTHADLEDYIKDAKERKALWAI
jgi:CDP-glucose 4,6-dehydratase